jgi:hypothetical protein
MARNGVFIDFEILFPCVQHLPLYTGIRLVVSYLPFFMMVISQRWYLCTSFFSFLAWSSACVWENVTIMTHLMILHPLIPVCFCWFGLCASLDQEGWRYFSLGVLYTILKSNYPSQIIHALLIVKVALSENMV